MAPRTPRFAPHRRDVAHEAFDGEVLLIHFPSGKYFRLDAPGLVGWSALEAGADVEEVAAALRRAFVVEDEVARASAAKFLRDLEQHGLVVEAAEAPAPAPPVVPAPATAPAPRAPFAEPTIEVFSDLQELFLVDPIHDVDETGWPHVKA